MDGFSFEEFSKFISALNYCADRHRNQRRKDIERTPYLNHPVQVAELLWRVGGVRDMAVLTAALLHDVIEDTGAGPDEIERLFGADVAALVLEVSDDKNLSKARRKELQVLHAPGLSRGAGLIKIADKICNVRDVTWSPPLNWTLQRRMEYLDWAAMVVERLGHCNPALEELFRKVLAEGKKELQASGQHG